MTDLAELLRRCEEATGPDRLLASDIGEALHPDEPWPFICADYTASIDAALALVSRKLPALHWTVRSVIGGASAQVGDELAFAATAPLAIICALLKALTSEQARVLNNTEDGNG